MFKFWELISKVRCIDCGKPNVAMSYDKHMPIGAACPDCGKRVRWFRG